MQRYTSACLMVAAALLLAAACPNASAQQKKQRDKRGENHNFDKTGVQQGKNLPELTVKSIEGQDKKLAEVWADKPALVVTCSLTCPVARRRQAEINKIAEQFKDRLNIVMVYTIEAHPKTDPSPYRGDEWITPQNERESILRRQPGSFEQRVELAKEYQQRIATPMPILIDGMDNAAWKAFGGGPNLGLLMTPEGKVEVKHGWFDGKTMARSIENYLKKYEKSKG